ncbi:3-deoxy-manno-octulosonate cytidylyltransferase [Aurantibacillus circumpalustris]|uniref:3-deoxy-manno-octulosonate cytidylyltransferase n=1 Tax=Aurantibacillus circumpalustris TaxID=3036359 RepID=UPI00295A8D44|nr:3-deoxy-manno-octulosonate cytidylyltransferase [Aurantibacillus circumpalustris]
MSIIGIIPARFASSRFPGKPLVVIKGKSMLQRVYEQTLKSNLLDEVIIATDDARILEHAKTFGAKAVLTKVEHPSGTDRCFEAYQLNGKKFDYVINVQGDEPFLDPDQINSLAQICDGTVEIATQMIKCISHEVLFDRGEVKIVLNAKKEALYFSRNVIPFIKNVNENEWHKHFDYYRHVGMYAYRVDILDKITQLRTSTLELAESLEQLRWLQNGYKITCTETNFDSHCVDTPEDIEKVIRLMNIQ